jgi:hypothetical protein
MLTSLFTRTRHKQADEESGAPRRAKGNRRASPRFDVKRYNGIITNDGLSHQFRLRNLSCTGVSGLTAAPIEEGQTVPIELVKGVPCLATVRWTRGTSVGLSFRQRLPMHLVSAILEADQRHCSPARDEELTLGPLTGIELSDVGCPVEEWDDPSEDPQMANAVTIDQDRHTEDMEEIQGADRDEDENAEDGLDPSGEEGERRSEPRIRVLLLIAKITNWDSSGLCCLRSISNSGLMAETNLVLRPGDEVQLDLSDRHRLCGRVVWRDEAGVGVALDEPIDSVLLLNQLAHGDAEPPETPAPVEPETDDRI